MDYLNKFKSISGVVNLKIPHNKKNFTPSEKRLITIYYNKADNMGLLNDARIGYQDVDISRRKFKIKNAPRFKKVRVNVGTTQKANGEIITAENVKISFKGSRVYTKRPDGANRWQFYYDINKDWKLAGFKRHLLGQMGKKPEEGEFYMVGAGVYVIPGMYDAIEDVAKEILKLNARYKALYETIEKKADSGAALNKYEKKRRGGDTNDWLTNVVVYNSREAVAEYKRKTRKKRKSGGKKNGKENRRN